MLVIHPGECIDCGKCAPECRVEAIKPDTEPGLKKWIKLNRACSRIWFKVSIIADYPTTAPWMISRRKA